jgi:hypothetical protein
VERLARISAKEDASFPNPAEASTLRDRLGRIGNSQNAAAPRGALGTLRYTSQQLTP